MVFKKAIDENDALQIIEAKKTGAFRTMLQRPKKQNVHMHSLKLYYECLLVVSGKYVADYYRMATHTISVDSNVKEAVLGDAIFPVQKKSAFKRAFVGKRGKNKIDLKVEEHVYVEEEAKIVFDHDGQETQIPFKVDSKIIENYPKRILSKNKEFVRRSELTHEEATSRLQEHLKKSLASEVRGITEEFSLDKITEIYVPIFEARLVGPKKKVAIMRLDAVKKKIL